MGYLILKDLDKRYTPNADLVVRGVNLAIEKGEFVVLLGPSGCGKTTTMRMISGLEEATAGDILLEGKSIIRLPARLRGVSMVFQSYAVWPHMTVYKNIAYALKIKKTPKPEIDRIVKETAEICDISDYLGRYPSQLSGGQKQRVAVARALAIKPKLFLMDEPLSNLDAKLRVQMRTELKKIHVQTGSTSIFVTHDQSEAMSLADRIVVMKDGRIEQIGTPHQVYHDSQTVFVASFIGSPPTNFYEVEIVKDQGSELVAMCGDVRFPIAPADREALDAYVGKTVLLGIRPEYFALSEQRADDALCRITVDIVEPQGSFVIISADVCGVVSKITTTTHFEVKPGSSFYVSVDSSKLFFFEKESQRRIGRETI